MKPASDDARFAPPPDDPVLNAPDPADVDQDLLVFFLMECTENFDNIEASLLAFEKNPSSPEAVKNIYRLAHSTKGAANSMGFSALGGLFHRVEDLMEDVVEGNATPRPADLANLLLSVLDVSKAMLADSQAGKPLYAHRPKLRELLTGLARLRALSAKTGAPETAPAAAPVAAPAPQPDFAPAELAAEAEDDASETASDSDLRVLRVETERVDAVARLLDELVIARTRLERDISQLMSLRKELARSRQRLTHVVAEFQERFEFSLSRGQPLGASSAPASPADSLAAGFSDLELDRYDDFNILTRALVEISADSGEIISSLNRQFGTLNNDTADLSSATSRLQEEMLHMRMVPLRRLFRQLQRGVRDAAQAEGKQAELHLDGGKVRIDKIIFDKLVTPLLHLVRNSVSHGIESPSERSRLGKAETGLITLRAEQDGNHVRLSIRDDGRGLDLAGIRDVAVRRGLLRAEEQVSEARLKNLIFEPGFSTASTVSSVSGRGVGMDIVRQELVRLNGAIELHSEPGRGALFSLRLPLTTSVNQAVLIRVGGQQLALPLNYVEHVEEGFEDNVEVVDGNEFVKHNGQRVPLVRLDLLLGFSDGSNPAAGDIVITAVGADLLAVHVDEVLQRQDIVVKPLGPLFSKHSFLSGVTLTGGGRMVLVLDLPGIARKIRTAGLASSHARHTQFNAPSGKAAEARTVLVVDDSLSIRKISESYVTQLGYPVETAVDGADALAKLQEGNGRYGMVLSDLEMPRMNGFELIREMRKADTLRDIPVVVVTSRDAEKHRQAASEAGANAYVTKPFTTEQLGQYLRTYLAQEQAITSRRILVVDDSLSIRKIGENYVSALGYEVDVAVDGLDALEKLRSKDYGLVLSDLEMPRMNGFELIAALRREERLKNIPVVIVTSRDAAKHRARAEFEGAQGYITKPFTQDQLGERISHVLDQIANPPEGK